MKVKTADLSQCVQNSLANYWDIDDTTQYLELEIQDAVSLDTIESVMVELPDTIKRLGQVQSFNPAIEKLRKSFNRLSDTGKRQLEGHLHDIVDHVRVRVIFTDSLLNYLMQFYDVNTSTLIMVETAPELNQMLMDKKPHLQVQAVPAYFWEGNKKYRFSSQHMLRSQKSSPMVKGSSDEPIVPYQLTTTYERVSFGVSVPLSPFLLDRFNKGIVDSIVHTAIDGVEQNRWINVT